MSHLCDFEWEILEECSGMREARSWGAAVGAALEALNCLGLIRRGRATDKGLAALKERTSYSQPSQSVGNEGKKG